MNRMKPIIGKAALFAVVALLALGADAMAPGGIEKKFVGLLFDVIETSPSNVLANADQFAEHAPYLDGVALALQEVRLATRGGVTTSKYTRVMHPYERWTRDAVKDQIPILRAISKTPGLQESFLLFWITPNTREDRLDWRDDKAWANFAENMATAAWLAKEGGMKGLMLDHEEYASASQYHHDLDDPPFEECAKLARQRGREVFSRVFQEYPDAVIFLLSFFKDFSYFMEWGRQVHPATYADDAGRLLPYFYNGLLDAMPPEARVVDGAEHYNLSATRSQFLLDSVRQTSGALAFVAPENWVKYRSQLFVGNTHFLDMFTQDANPKSSWYLGPVDGSRLEHLRLNLEQSILSATKYIWLYGERGGKLFDWRDGHFDVRKTWEQAIPGVTETMMLAKDPEGFAAMRREKLKATGQLVNLAADVKPVSFENPAKTREYHPPAKDVLSVRGVKPGERYFVSVSFELRKDRRGRVHPEAVRPSVVWRKNGKQAQAESVPLPRVDQEAIGWTKAEAVVTVPDDVDELVVDRAASLGLGERVRYGDTTVNNLLDPASYEWKPSSGKKAEAGITVPDDVNELAVDQAASIDLEERESTRHGDTAVNNPLDPASGKWEVPSGKWVFDASARKLSNGNWRLTALLKGDALYVLGDEAGTVGIGSLDLSTVKADTGYPVSFLSRFGNCARITSLIVSDASSFANNAFFGCSNLAAVVVHDASAGKKAVLSVDRRREILRAMGVMPQLARDAHHVVFTHEKSIRLRRDDIIRLKDVKPGELYNVGLSMKRHGAGEASFFVRFRGNGRSVGGERAIAMKEPRAEDTWRSGEAVVRVPADADELYLDLNVVVNEGTDHFDFRDFTVYKIGDPLPKWPEEAERPKP